jgi:hypothetical protein
VEQTKQDIDPVRDGKVLFSDDCICFAFCLSSVLGRNYMLSGLHKMRPSSCSFVGA